MARNRADPMKLKTSLSENIAAFSSSVVPDDAAIMTRWPIPSELGYVWARDIPFARAKPKPVP